MSQKQKSKPKPQPKKRKRYTRTIKRYTLKINQTKWLLLWEIAEGHAAEKDYFLSQYNKRGSIYAAYSFLALRKKMVSKKYKSHFGLQNRQWKLALKDSLETIERYWAALSAQWKESIGRSSKLEAEEKIYLFKAIYSRRGLERILRYGAKVTFASLNLSLKQRKKCLRFLKKLLKKSVKKAPRVKKVRSFLAEPETYRVFMHKGRQYIALMSKKRGERLVLPLSGYTPISGMIRVVLDDEKQRAEIHYTKRSKSKHKRPKDEKKLGVDLGITEVFTDSDGQRWGKEFGQKTQKYSEEIKYKGQKRNKLHALVKKHREKGNDKKARRIEKHNLGTKKQDRKNSKRVIELTREVNESLNGLYHEKKPTHIVYEHLNHLRGKAKSKKLSRLVSLWIRGIIRKRLEFNSGVFEFQLKEVNSAHSSRVCEVCYWVDPNNRKADQFRCQVCQHQTHSDHSAAVELLRRDQDENITLYMNKDQVHQVLLDRFRKRWEDKNGSPPTFKPNWQAPYQVLGQSFSPAHCSNLSFWL